MSPFQILLLCVMSGFLVATAACVARGWMGRRVGVALALFILIGAAQTLWPDSSSQVARHLGIGRGADLLLYCTMMVTFTCFFLVYVRLRRLQRAITLLVRHGALKEATEEPRR